jgi:serine/threonine protein kinase
LVLSGGIALFAGGPMSLQELEPLFAERALKLPLKQYYADFCKQGDERDNLAFLSYLHQKHLLSREDYEEILPQLTLELTGLQLLDPFYDETHFVDQRQHGQTVPRSLARVQGKNYELLRQIGAGAMGSIHLAKDRFLRREVAFKKLLPGMASDEVIERFLSEVQITAQLDHPNVIPIYNLDSDEVGAPAYSMKIIRGISMKEWLAQIRRAYHEQKVPDEYELMSRLELYLKICDALMLAHRLGVIHRDLKPANIMLGEYNEVYVMDWGIARSFDLKNHPDYEAGSEQVEVDSSSYLEQEKGQIVGTPRYMSPEQAGGKNEILDQRSDIFAMGLILFEVLYLKRALVASSMGEILAKVIQGKFENAESAYGENISPALKAIFQKATQRRRVDRYQSINELADDVRRFINNEPVLAHKENLLFTLQRAVHRHRQKVIAGVLASFVLGTLGTGGLLYAKQISLKDAEERRLVLAKLQSELANQGQVMTGQFLRQEALLQELSGQMRVALERGLPADLPAFVLGPGQAPQLPADFAVYPGFKQARSFQYPLYLLPDAADYSADLKRLSALDFQGLFLKAYSAESIALPEAERMQQLRSANLPLNQVFATLSNGLHVRYPGQLPSAVFSPQSERYYQEYQNHTAGSLVWNESEPQHPYLRCITGVYDSQGKFMGLVGLQSKRAETLRPWLKLEQETRAMYLLNSQAQILEAEPPSAQLSAKELKRLKPVLADAAGSLVVGEQVFSFTRLGRGNLIFLAQSQLSELKGTQP